MKINLKILSILLLICGFGATGQIKIGDTIPVKKLEYGVDNQINFNQFKGKYVLVDFWASWCGPCRLGNKKLVKLHAELNPNLIEIVGISLDTDANKWKKAIERDKIKFAQFNDPHGFDAETALLFGVDELPTQFLFNRKGELIIKNPTEEEIINLIKK